MSRRTRRRRSIEGPSAITTGPRGHETGGLGVRNGHLSAPCGRVPPG
ncbi:hypothetical protein [Streptomyces spectabilis]|uniref:Uncharacterized protein n=1 Tax=Streptomyces spectabilis TaxID=68270 RepID=A0A7W8APL4_STRST|nr:hypothetical protein [Streptomyces spectabilis]MBB5102256.1 hypothetical protein [Streptomyces spectabilis]MCI3907304.1 hypothetical protein [Streptomyces spectabilis]